MAKKTLVMGSLICVLILVGVGVGYWYFLVPKPESAPKTLLIQTTTSLDATGFLTLIRPAFFEEFNINISWVAVGTGQALTNAGNGDADVVVVHSQPDEYEFINHSSTTKSYSGKGIMRVNVGYNFFVLVGPKSDPAKILGTSSESNITEAFKKIYDSGSSFISRGDLSGTHTKEKAIWTAAKLTNYASQSWYKSAGQGMSQVLTMCQNDLAYTLADYGTWLKVRNVSTNLINMTNTVDPLLKNTYSVICVDPDKFTNRTIDFEGAKKFEYFMLTSAQKIMDEFKVDGETPFISYKNYTGTCFCGSDKCEVENGRLYWVVFSVPNPLLAELKVSSGSIMKKPEI